MAMVAWKEKAMRARAALARLREHAVGTLPNVRRDGETVAAGMLAGALRGAFEASGKEYAIPVPGGMGKVPPELPMGALVLAVAFSGQTDVSEDLHAIGAGILAYSAGREAEIYMKARGSRTPGEAQ